MAQSGADKHEGGVAVRETAHLPSAAADLPVEPLNDVIGTDASPVFAGKIAVAKNTAPINTSPIAAMTEATFLPTVADLVETNRFPLTVCINILLFLSFCPGRFSIPYTDCIIQQFLNIRRRVYFFTISLR